MKSVIIILGEDEFEARLEEINALANTAGYETFEVFTQTSRPRPRFFIGAGKVKEIKKAVKQNSIELVIFENFLSSRQIMSLEGEFGIPVIDRFDLILNVFERHAGSREAMFQIELARLKRKLPYIKMFLGKRVREEHPGFGGSGEFIIHSTIRAINKRIKKIEEALEKFYERARMQRDVRREEGKTVSLVGYTNVGKTTLLNALTHAGKEVRDELFTTLRTKTSSFSIDGEKIFVDDTIGFIRNLPHELIYAFRATLSDIGSSDLILLVLDISEPIDEFVRKKDICENTLVEIGADNIPVLYVLNKVDRLKKDEEKEKMLEKYVKISAKNEVGLETLKDAVKKMIGVQG